MKRELRYAKVFRLTEDHIKLLRASYVRWWGAEFGAACIDPKRPYGSSGGYLQEIARIIGMTPVTVKSDDGPIYTDEQEEYCLEVHQETPVALQIILLTGEFRPGVYKRESEYDSREWGYYGPLTPEKAPEREIDLLEGNRG